MRVFDPALKTLADTFEACGYTSPDKHDMQLVVFGKRVRQSEIGVIDGRVAAKCGEAMLAPVKKMFRTLPANHNLGTWLAYSGE